MGQKQTKMTNNDVDCHGFNLDIQKMCPTLTQVCAAALKLMSSVGSSWRKSLVSQPAEAAELNALASSSS